MKVELVTRTEGVGKYERWEDISCEEGIPNGLYKVSCKGNIFSTRYGKIIKPNLDVYGYHITHLRYKGYRIARKIHRLVLKYFKGDSELDVNHKDGVKTNNTIENLEYVTKSENMKHAQSMGFVTTSFKSGERHTQVKYSDDVISKVRELASEGVRYKDILNKTGLKSMGHISGIVNFKTRK